MKEFHNFQIGDYVTFERDSEPFRKGEVAVIRNCKPFSIYIYVEGSNTLCSCKDLRLANKNEIEGYKSAKADIEALAKSQAFFINFDEYKGYKSCIQRFVPSLNESFTGEQEDIEGFNENFANLVEELSGQVPEYKEVFVEGEPYPYYLISRKKPYDTLEAIGEFSNILYDKCREKNIPYCALNWKNGE